MSVALLAGRPMTDDRSGLDLVFSESYDAFIVLLVEKRIHIKRK
ncbi:hypothetical protein J2X69_002046 [Algoriphagus sp. 4150]|nr:hypothetical protein [Algoriphagus sp. 4150]